MGNIFGPKKRARLAGMFASFAQLILGAGFVSYFFKEGPTWVRIMATVFFFVTVIGAIIAEPEEGGK